MNEESWIVNSKPTWIEEEELLLNWAENPNFYKQPLDIIAITFIYVKPEQPGDFYTATGTIKTAIDLGKHNSSFSVIKKSDFFEKVEKAKTPKQLVDNSISNANANEWLSSTYIFDSAAIYSIPIDHEHINQFNPTIPFIPLQFSNNIAKIYSSLNIFHDLYEIIVIMKEMPPISLPPPPTLNELKSILKDGSKIGKTKKVRISDELPKEYVFSKIKPISGKKRTRKSRN